MISNSREKDIQAKQEGEAKAEKLSKAASSSRQWSGFRNPRIVRVSRSFGGKDRHSKVCTIRGLRDRRIRLSVPTAVQLYDLQDRLGLGQPSKVIDWLLDATKLDIDKLPPLPIPQGFTQFHPQLFSHEPNASQPSFIPSFDANPTFINDGADQNAMEKSKYWDIDAAFRLKSKEVETGSAADKGKWIKTNEEVIQEGIGGYSGQISAQKFFPLATDCSSNSLPGLLNNAMAYNSYHHSEPSSLSLSQFGSHGLFPSQMNPHTSNVIQLPPSLPLPPASQFFFCPSTATPALFTPYSSYITTPIESDPRQFNHIQFLSSSSQHVLPHPLMPPSLHSMSLPLKSFPTNENSKLPQSQEDNGSRVDKDNTGS